MNINLIKKNLLHPLHPQSTTPTTPHYTPTTPTIYYTPLHTNPNTIFYTYDHSPHVDFYDHYKELENYMSIHAEDEGVSLFNSF